MEMLKEMIEDEKESTIKRAIDGNLHSFMDREEIGDEGE